MQRIVVIPYRRFGTAYQSLFQGPTDLLGFLFLDFLPLEDGADMLSPNVGKELSPYAA
jgi:hypothetical protein